MGPQAGDNQISQHQREATNADKDKAEMKALIGIAINGVMSEAKQHPWTSTVVLFTFLGLIGLGLWAWMSLARASDMQQVATQVSGIARRSLEVEICNLDKARQKSIDPSVRAVIGARYQKAQAEYKDTNGDYYPTELCVE